MRLPPRERVRPSHLQSVLSPRRLPNLLRLRSLRPRRSPRPREGRRKSKSPSTRKMRITTRFCSVRLKLAQCLLLRLSLSAVLCVLSLCLAFARPSCCCVVAMCDCVSEWKFVTCRLIHVFPMLLFFSHRRCLPSMTCSKALSCRFNGEDE